MSRVYDAKQVALKSYPNHKGDAVDLFLSYIDIDAEEFEDEFDETPEQYIYGE